MKASSFAKSMIRPVLSTAGIFFVSGLHADDFDQTSLTYAKDAAPILFAHCAGCHRPGENAPMTLLSYEETRPWAKAIKKSVESRDMPPWDADPAYGHFANDISLSEKQIATLVKWVDQGALQGDPAATPPLPKFTEGWKLGEPDYVIELDEISVPADGPDQFPNIYTSVSIPEDHWIRAAEVRPGNNQVLHHVVAFMGSGGGAGGGGNPLSDVLAVWAVGTPPTVYPEGMGREVKKGLSLTVNMHYHSNGSPQKDKTRIGLFWGKGEMQKKISSAFAGDFLIKIPPGAADHKMESSYTLDQDSQIVSYFPHMHMRGREMTYTATYPDGRKEIVLRVPKYDFNWQWFYYPSQTAIMPAGTRIDIVAKYDNSANNPNNPDPNQLVTFGEQSTDEMFFGVFDYVPVEGVRPRPVNVAKKIDNLIATLPADAAYRVSFGAGMMNLPTALLLPKSGEGIWYFPFGGQMIKVSLADLSWNGSDFTFKMEMPGQGVIVGKGSVTAEGELKGEFDASGMPERPSANPGGAFPRNFSGKRAG